MAPMAEFIRVQDEDVDCVNLDHVATSVHARNGGYLLKELPDGKLCSADGVTYNSLDRAKAATLRRSQSEWDNKHREEASDAPPAA